MDWIYYKRLFVSILGIYIIYLNYGLVQEKIYRYEGVDGSRFKYTSVLLLCQCAINLLVATIGYSVFGRSKRQFDIQMPRTELIGRQVKLLNRGKEEKCTIHDITVDGSSARISFQISKEEVLERVIRNSLDVVFVQDSLMDYWKYGICYTLAMIFSNSSLKHVTYPTQVLAKSCKMIPILLAGTIFKTRRYSFQKYISVLILTSGIVLFQLMSKKKKMSRESDSSFGLVLLFLSLCMDGICGMQQDIVVPRFMPTPMRLQQMLNTFGIVVSLLASIAFNELMSGLSFLQHNPSCFWLVIQFGLYSSIGQWFILYSVRYFPPLVTSTITTTRKFFSILLSVLFMGNEINLYQWGGVFLVFFGIFFDQVQSNRKKSHGN